MELKVIIFENGQEHCDDTCVGHYMKEFPTIQSVWDWAASLLKKGVFEFEMLSADSQNVFSMYADSDICSGWLIDEINATDPSSWADYNDRHPEIWDAFDKYVKMCKEGDIDE